jgi:lysozyme family protein
MVPQTYDAAMKRVLADEGGYSNDRDDPGGPTKYGITIIDVRKYLKPTATAEDVKALTLADAVTIYRLHYARPIRYDDLPAGIDYTVFDYGINSGVGRSGKVLRRVLGLRDDISVVSDDVLAAVKKRDPKAVIIAINDERLRFLQSLRIWPTFGKGWGRRVAGCKAASLHMVGAIEIAAPPASPAPGKGTVPDPKGVKNTVTVGTGGALAAGGGTWMDWVVAHPFLSVVIVVWVGIAVAIVIAKINSWHRSKQETPMPGTAVVSEIIPNG